MFKTVTVTGDRVNLDIQWFGSCFSLWTDSDNTDDVLISASESPASASEYASIEPWKGVSFDIRSAGKILPFYVKRSGSTNATLYVYQQ